MGKEIQNHDVRKALGKLPFKKTKIPFETCIRSSAAEHIRIEILSLNGSLATATSTCWGRSRQLLEWRAEVVVRLQPLVELWRGAEEGGRKEVLRTDSCDLRISEWSILLSELVSSEVRSMALIAGS
jgi:hypothetical protein